MSKNFRQVFAISGGTPGLASLMDIYRNTMRTFKCDGKKHPVIMLIDKDDGSKEIDKKMKKSRALNNSGYFSENLYVSVIPSQNKYCEIEDLFEQKVLDTKVNGKSFNRKEPIDIKTEYGKIIFAEKVIKPNQDKINFNKFKVIFDQFSEITKNYKKEMSK